MSVRDGNGNSDDAPGGPAAAALAALGAAAGQGGAATGEGGAAAGGRRVPRDCGSFDIHIKRDGTWLYRGSPIGRLPLVKLFSTVLERDEAGGYWLSTPAERGSVTVEDAPFVAVEVTAERIGREQVLMFRTNVDDSVTVDPEHPLRVENDPASGAPNPYVMIRKGLEARLLRPVFYHLVELAVEERVAGQDRLGVWSAGHFFPIDGGDPVR